MRETELLPLAKLNPRRLQSATMLNAVTRAARQLAELKGVAHAIPNPAILTNTLGIREAQDSCAIENIIATQDELLRDAAFPSETASVATKDVRRYLRALESGLDEVQRAGLLVASTILKIHKTVSGHSSGFRQLPGTVLRDRLGRTVYTPPQHPGTVVSLMSDLERFINSDDAFDADPLVRMAIIHYQFESIHPFSDGNGRTGRILNSLYLVQKGLLDAPMLDLSRYILGTRADYYRLLQDVRDRDALDEWVLYMLKGVESTARDAIVTARSIAAAMIETKHRVRGKYRFYSQDLMNNLFTHPYTKIQFIERDLGVSRLTATRYLDTLAEGGVLQKIRVGRSNYYKNVALLEILLDEPLLAHAS